ncbi:MAG: sigma factor, partial [Candidatus Limnocylindrales bacterium]
MGRPVWPLSSSLLPLQAEWFPNHCAAAFGQPDVNVWAGAAVIECERGQTVAPAAERHVQRDFVEAAQRGDHEAFEALAISTGDRLFAIARPILRDVDRAEDAVQDALVQAWRALLQLRDPDRFDAWIRKLIVNACSEAGRRSRRWDAPIRVLPPPEPVADSSHDIATR